MKDSESDSTSSPHIGLPTRIKNESIRNFISLLFVNRQSYININQAGLIKIISGFIIESRMDTSWEKSLTEILCLNLASSISQMTNKVIMNLISFKRNIYQIVHPDHHYDIKDNGNIHFWHELFIAVNEFE